MDKIIITFIVFIGLIAILGLVHVLYSNLCIQIESKLKNPTYEQCGEFLYPIIRR